MKPRVVWRWAAWEQYSRCTDRALVRRINELIKDIERNGNEGIGKPELLRGDLSGFASRRVNEEHRLVYRLRGDDIEILSCLHHYKK